MAFHAQAKLQQQLDNAEATEQLLQGELSAAKQQLQQAQDKVQQVTADARAAADAAKADHAAQVQLLQQQLGGEANAQVGCSGLQHTHDHTPVNCGLGIALQTRPKREGLLIRKPCCTCA